MFLIHWHMTKSVSARSGGKLVLDNPGLYFWNTKVQASCYVPALSHCSAIHLRQQICIIPRAQGRVSGPERMPVVTVLLIGFVFPFLIDTTSMVKKSCAPFSVVSTPRSAGTKDSSGRWDAACQHWLHGGCHVVFRPLDCL